MWKLHYISSQHRSCHELAAERLITFLQTWMMFWVYVHLGDGVWKAFVSPLIPSLGKLGSGGRWKAQGDSWGAGEFVVHAGQWSQSPWAQTGEASKGIQYHPVPSALSHLGSQMACWERSEVMKKQGQESEAKLKDLFKATLRWIGRLYPVLGYCVVGGFHGYIRRWGSRRPVGGDHDNYI
jgi:hypothetical protein